MFSRIFKFLTSTHAIQLRAPFFALFVAIAAVAWALPLGLASWSSLAICTAWAGAGLLVASLVFMLREPRMAVFFGGPDKMYHWHRRCGVVSYLLFLAHPLAFAMAGWAESPQSAWAALSPSSEDWPVWLGWGALLLLMLGMSAAFGVTLAYRGWRLLHYVLVLGVVLGLAHVYLVISDQTVLIFIAVTTAVVLGLRFFRNYQRHRRC